MACLWWSLTSFAQAAPTILVYGDSLSAGYGLSVEQGWVSLLGERLEEEGRAHRVVNLSVSGETSAGGASRIEGALRRTRPDIVILELGANDGLRGLPVVQTRRNLERIVRQSQQAGARVLLVGVELPPNYGMAYAQKFRAMYKDLAREYDLPFVPMLLAGVALTEQWFQADRLHPNAAAQPALLANVWRKLQPMLIREAESAGAEERSAVPG